MPVDKPNSGTYYLPTMKGEQPLFEYNHPVKMFAESGELLGTGHFVGKSWTSRSSGEPRWSGNLDTNVDPLLLVQSGELRLEFGNGAIGHARCTNSSLMAYSRSDALFLVALKGVGEPPRVEASQLIRDVPRRPRETPAATCPRCQRDGQVMYSPGGPIALCNPCWVELGAQWDTGATEKD